MSHRAFTRAIIGLSIAAFTIAGCATPQQASKQAGSGAPASSAPTSVPTEGDSPYDTEPPAVEETTPAEEEPAVAKVGATQWFTYEDGLKVQVTKVARFKISQYASGGTPGGSGVIVTVTIRNGTKKTADLTLTTVKLAYGANGDQADDVFDSENGLDGGFEGSVTPGHARTAKLGFAVPKGRQAMDVEVQPGFDYESVHFEGSVK